MGESTARKSSSAEACVTGGSRPISIRRRRTAVAAFRRERRTTDGGFVVGADDTRAVPDWGRIVLRAGRSITLR